MPSSPPLNADEIKTLCILGIPGSPLCFRTTLKKNYKKLQKKKKNKIRKDGTSGST
jgi:hypothetical protein